MSGSPTHIKNPLTIIGIFASLVEMFGISSLPFLPAPIQNLYIWFVMGFPTILVISFFCILIFKPEVLYAPSDFRTDKSFLDLRRKLTPALPEAIQNKIETEGAQAETFLSSEPVLLSKSEQSREIISSEEKNEATIESNSNKEFSFMDEPVDQFSIRKSPGRLRFELTERNATLRKSVRAEEMAIQVLSEERSLIFDRNVRFGGSTHVFDALAIDDRNLVAVEVRYTRNGIFTVSAIQRIFKGPAYLYNDLSQEQKNSLEFHILIVSDPGDVKDRINTEKARYEIIDYSRNLPFKTTVRVIEWDSLMKRSDFNN